MVNIQLEVSRSKIDRAGRLLLSDGVATNNRGQTMVFRVSVIMLCRTLSLLIIVFTLTPNIFPKDVSSNMPDRNE